MIRLSNRVIYGLGNKFQPPFYTFYCDDCEKELYTVAMATGVYTIKTIENTFNLCKDCYKKRTSEELSEIARMSSDMVIKDLAKMDKHSEFLKTEGIIIKNRDPYLEDLIKYLELKRLNP